MYYRIAPHVLRQSDLEVCRPLCCFSGQSAPLPFLLCLQSSKYAGKRLLEQKKNKSIVKETIYVYTLRELFQKTLWRGADQKSLASEDAIFMAHSKTQMLLKKAMKPIYRI